jgi:hypothetical protein
MTTGPQPKMAVLDYIGTLDQHDDPVAYVKELQAAGWFCGQALRRAR